MYSDMSIRTIASSSPNRNSASVRASSVFFFAGRLRGLTIVSLSGWSSSSPF